MFSISILLMDGDGLPVPFFTTVYHGEDGTGIKHLVDLNHDGHAQLLISSYDEIPSDTRVGPFCSGHWITQLYRFKNFGGEEVRGPIGGIGFPFVRDWTYRGTECPDEEKPLSSVQPAALYEHGTSTQGKVVTTIRKSSTDDFLEVDPVAGCRAITTALVVYDRPKIREIGFPNLFTTYTDDLADTIRRDGARIELRGINKRMGNGNCSVNLLWATAARSR